jgi:hypothetical protein
MTKLFKKHIYIVITTLLGQSKTEKHLLNYLIFYMSKLFGIKVYLQNLPNNYLSFLKLKDI